MRSATIIFACAVVTGASLHVAEAAGRTTITAEQVAAVLNQRGIPVSVDQLTMLSDVSANSAHPQLEVESVERLDASRTAVRLECVSREQCLPFVVTVGQSAEAKQGTTADNQPKVIAVRTGSMATLHLDGAHIHISMTVICLDSGSVGQTIRAASLDRHKVYMVRVLGNESLEGGL